MRLVVAPSPGNFPCIWCGATFNLRSSLDAHWRGSAECGRNKNVSNAYQPGSHAFGERPVMPGEHTLRLVREHSPGDERQPDPRLQLDLD